MVIKSNKRFLFIKQIASFYNALTVSTYIIQLRPGCFVKIYRGKYYKEFMVFTFVFYAVLRTQGDPLY